MKIINGQLHKYELPLVKPLRLKDQTITEREGLIVTLTDENGNRGQGEIAPLPGFSPESLDQAKARALDVLELLISVNEISSWKSPPNSIKCHDCGSVRFGFESAFLMLHSTWQRKPVNKSINDAARDEVLINSLITEPAKAEIEATKLIKAGFQSIKLKLGRQPLADDIVMVQKLKDIVKGKATLRLDVNRSWSVRDTISFVNKVGGRAIEYLEEPVRSAIELGQLIDKKIKVALDETLIELPSGRLKEFLSSGSVSALVLKPTMLGLNRSLELAKLAAGFNVTAVISSSFESALGLTMLANIASAVNKTNIPAGLDTWRYFKSDLFNFSISNSGTSVDVKEVLPHLVDIESLQEITVGR